MQQPPECLISGSHAHVNALTYKRSSFSTNGFLATGPTGLCSCSHFHHTASTARPLCTTLHMVRHDAGHIVYVVQREVSQKSKTAVASCCSQASVSCRFKHKSPLFHGVSVPYTLFLVTVPGAIVYGRRLLLGASIVALSISICELPVQLSQATRSTGFTIN